MPGARLASCRQPPAAIALVAVALVAAGVESCVGSGSGSPGTMTTAAATAVEAASVAPAAGSDAEAAARALAPQTDSVAAAEDAAGEALAAALRAVASHLGRPYRDQTRVRRAKQLAGSGAAAGADSGSVRADSHLRAAAGCSARRPS